MPDGGRGFPVVLVVQEIFGVHEHIRDVCRRFAKAGYLAIAPELYARQGDVSKMTDVQEIVTKVVANVPDAQVMADLDATVAWAKASGAGDTAKLGITGFCWGGRIVWLYAAHNPALRAGVAWYGRLVGPTTALQPEQSHRPREGAEGAGSRALWRRRSRHPARVRRTDAGGVEGRRLEVGDRGVSGRAARLLRRLSPDVSRGRGARTAGSASSHGFALTARGEKANGPAAPHSA